MTEVRRFPVVLAGLLLVIFLPQCLPAEVRLSVDAEFYNTVTTGDGTDDWRYYQYGTAGVAFRNKGSRLVRGELVLDFAQFGGTAAQPLAPVLKRLYIRPCFGDVLVSLGKTRSTWGAGLAFNAGDIIFGSDSVDFNTRSADPRSETAWLTNVEIPLGAFSFLEFIAMPGNIGHGGEGAAGAVELPGISDASAGVRIGAEAGPFTIQSGYLYRGDEIAGLGEVGHRAFVSIEGIAPVDWHLSTSASKDSWMITGGAFYDHTVGYDMNLSWRAEALIKPYASFTTVAADGAAPAAVVADYGLYFYPSISLTPRGNVTWSVSSVVSPVDVSANNTAGMSWNIYEELMLEAYISLQTGERGDVFNPDNPAAASCTIGVRYSY